MRDPKRIKPILDALGIIWQTQPDTRLGQLLSNIAHQDDVNIFNLSDDRLLELLRHDPLTKLRTKGLLHRTTLLHLEGDPLTLEQVSDKLGIHKPKIERMIENHEILSVTEDESTALFPIFQFTDTGILSGLSDVLYAMEPFSFWTKLMFLHTQDVRLNDRTPLQALRDGDVVAVVDAAKAYGNQGAA